MRDRAYRRSMEQRQKRRVKKYIKETWGEGNKMYEDPKRVGKQSHVHGICSCHMCGNPRKYFNQKTKQEVIADISDQQLNFFEN